MREKTVEATLRAGMKSLGGLAMKLTPVGEIGWPDRLCLFPGGQVAFVELKAPGKKPTALQLHRLETLKDLGFVALWLDSPTSVREWLKEVV